MNPLDEKTTEKEAAVQALLKAAIGPTSRKAKAQRDVTRYEFIPLEQLSADREILRPGYFPAKLYDRVMPVFYGTRPTREEIILTAINSLPSLFDPGTHLDTKRRAIANQLSKWNVTHPRGAKLIRIVK